ncbi:hypothetical protein HF908_24540 (plasmid) [Ralstonia pseudosolanacearum]|nr:hypothetical protein HF908_24540 [Ralstonia pseudosolanacearum]
MENLICFGTVAEVDYDTPPRIRAGFFGLLMTWRPRVIRRASTRRTWLPPAKRERVLPRQHHHPRQLPAKRQQRLQPQPHRYHYRVPRRHPRLSDNPAAGLLSVLGVHTILFEAATPRPSQVFRHHI